MVMRIFKKFLKMTAFLLILCILLGGISWIVAPRNFKNMHHAASYGFLGEKENTLDILVLGDSESYVSISPMQIWRDYGYTSYICGTPLQYAEETYDFFTQFNQSQTPKVVILETNFLYRSDGRFDDIFRSMKNAVSRILPVFDYHDRWKKIITKDFKITERYTGRDGFKGFRLKEKIVPYEGKSEYMIYTDKVKKIPDRSIHYFEKIYQYCNENNIELILFNAASPVNWSYEKHNGVEQLAQKYDLPYIDMNLLTEELKIDWKKDTCDKGDHLNIYGAQKVTEYLGEYIKNNFDLNDHRGNKDYEYWNDDLKAYEKHIEKLKKT